jgi:hypothetical protein
VCRCAREPHTLALDSLLSAPKRETRETERPVPGSLSGVRAENPGAGAWSRMGPHAPNRGLAPTRCELPLLVASC